MRDYDELNEAEQEQLADAWVVVAQGLSVYEAITGARLKDIVNEEIWLQVNIQKGLGL